MNYQPQKAQLQKDGFSVLNEFYAQSEVKKILTCIESCTQKNEHFLVNKDLFAIRQLINVIPELKQLLFIPKLLDLLGNLDDGNLFLTKAIYFDKPSSSNWFVSYHQDLSISVDRKHELDGYTNWTIKRGQFGVQPPLQILEHTFTVRIHLDDTNKENGALKVIPASHLDGICRLGSVDLDTHQEQVCELAFGGIMLMKPLIFHASGRTKNKKRRRVIHLEFCSKELNKPLQWLERHDFFI